jgi:SRSO17 transposase
MVNWDMEPLTVPKASPAPLPELASFLTPFAPLFRRSQSRESLERYVTGLLTDLPHKTCDTIAAAVAGTSTERLQHLLTDADWDPAKLDEQRVRQLVSQSPAAGILVLDDTSFPKQGTQSVGVQRQYCGALGKRANCQVVVSAEYVTDEPASSAPLHWPVTGQLYLPEGWADDPQRRKRAHIPEEITFQTKPEIALSLLDRAREWEVPFRFVSADAGYGDNPKFLEGLEKRKLPYVCAVERSFGVRLPDEVREAAAATPEKPKGKGRPKLPRPAPLYTVEAVSAAQDESAWRTITWREGTKGELRKQFLAVRAHRATGNPAVGEWGRSARHGRMSTGSEGWLLAERPVPGEEGERKYYYSDLPADTPLERLAALAHARWVIEQFYEDAKGECGLGDYQGRRWDGLHRHLALAMLTYGFLTLQRHAAPDHSAGGFSPLGAPTDLPGGASPDPHLAVPGPGAVAHRHRSSQTVPPST